MPILAETYACMPNTERGRGILISGGHPESNAILYTNGRSVVSLNLDNPLDVWVCGEHAYLSTVSRFSPNGERGSGYNGRIQRKENTQIKCLAVIEEEIIASGYDNKFGRLSVHGSDCGDAEFIDIGLNCPEFTLWTTDTGVILLRGTKVVSTIDLGFTVTASAVSPDGDEAIIGEQNGKLHIYSFSGDSLHEVSTLEKHRGAISVIRYSPDLSMFASADLNIEAVVWDRASREVKVKNMLYHTACINCLAWSPDSSRLATGSLDMFIIIYEVNKLASTRQTIKGVHLGGLYGLTFTDDYSVASSGEDACIRLWGIDRQW